MPIIDMQLIALRTLRIFWTEHPETEASLRRWVELITAGTWRTPMDIVRTFGTAKVISPERVRFEVHGGNYRLIAAFDFNRQIAFVKFVGTHKQYDCVDATTVSQF